VEFFTVAVTLFLVMDPMGNIPIFLSILERLPAERQRRVIVRELLLALGVIIVVALVGRQLMGLLSLRPESVSVAGGIILFIIALRMVFPRTRAQIEDEVDGEPFFVPLAVPLVAGPSSLSILMLFAAEHPGQLPTLLGAAGAAWAASFAILYGATFFLRVLGKRGLIAMERLMGMVLVAIAVQLFLDGVARAFGS
jgi:multiple antibiotic resistance protein